ncbi:MAG: polysaccharide pyruvyl transferase family protein [Clostridiales bacterium]|nr:polysaccharide pyruvyl transferase family protein [Clostridiales bacterium]
MKIGIITFHASYNCGSILQCMALKRVLEDKGHTVDIINYSSKSQQKLYSVFYKKMTLKNIVKNFLCIPGYSTIKNHYKQYGDYIKRIFNLESTPLITEEEMLHTSLPEYDVLIAGGDQVWNVKVEDFSTAYFLDFSDNAYKFSYSPSLGATNINESEFASTYRELLLRFGGISCREVNGKKWLEELTGRHVDLVLDPSFLLNSQVWNSYIVPSDSLPFSGFIFYYAFSYSPANNEIVQSMAEQANLPVYIIDSKQWYIKHLSKYKNFVLCKDTGPNAFLSLMRNADYVMTTSFHGTAFSLIYEKKFVYLETEGHEPTDDRTSFLIKQVGLADRYIYPKEVTLKLLSSPINYPAVNEKLDALKEIAFKYLDGHLEEAGRGRQHDIS